VLISHLVWTVLCVLLILALLGVAHTNQTINLRHRIIVLTPLASAVATITGNPLF
jgi:hypothetical protein